MTPTLPERLRLPTGNEAGEAVHSQRRVAYVIGTFPSLTTTFIDREILELKRCGLGLTLLGIRRPPAQALRPEVERLAQETRYILPVRWQRLLADHGRFAVTRPRAFWGTLAYLLTRPHPSARARLKTLLHFGEGVRAAALLQSGRVQHLHAHFADRAAIVAMVAARLLGVTYSLTAHANDIYVAPVLLREKISQAKFVVTCTAHNQAYLARLAQRPIKLVYHGLDFSGLNPPTVATPPRTQPLILSVGQLKDKKGFQYLIAASRLLKDRGLSFRCEIVGDGPNRAALARLIADLGLEDTVSLRGAQPNTAVMALYPQALFFVLPSVPAPSGDRDGIPNVLLEAMAHNLPVISTQHSGIPELVQDGVTGLLVPPGDAEALAAAMHRLWQDGDLRQRLARQGREFVERHFDVRPNTRGLAELLTS